jgi:hypothetical protein
MQCKMQDTSRSFFPPFVYLLELVYICDTNLIYFLYTCKAIINHQLCYCWFAGVLDCKFHPRQPWLFTAGADTMIRLYCD